MIQNFTNHILLKRGRPTYPDKWRNQSLMLEMIHDMAERKNFLLFAIGIGVMGIIIGSITIWNMVSDVLK